MSQGQSSLRPVSKWTMFFEDRVNVNRPSIGRPCSSNIKYNVKDKRANLYGILWPF